VSIHHIKADSSIWFFDCWSGQAATVLAISRSCILELTCPNGDARAAIREGSVAFVALCAPFLELESADEYGHDPTALQMKLQTGVERVYRMGAREVAQALQLLLKTINCEFDVDWCRGLIAQDADASVAQDVGTNREKKKHRAAHLIALGCVSFVRVSKMRGERSSKVRIRSFIYTIAFWMLREATRDVQTLDNAERDVISSMATTRLAPGGQSLLPGVSEEEIRKTLTLASQNR
jgi:hypothetical protein